MREINNMKPRVKILGDAGIYTVWIIDWYNQKALINRVCGDEWVKFEKKQGFMWPTGRKDKNGKEVFEGNLLKETYPAGYSIHEICFGEYDNGEEYEDKISGYGWYTKEHRHWPEYELTIGDYSDIHGEVIGDIYTTPELLKEDK